MKMMYLFTILSFLLAVTVQTVAQTKVDGYVVDNSDNPVPYATVVLKSLSDSTVVKGNITDEKGYYFFEDIANGNYLIQASYVGFQSMLSSAISLSQEKESIVVDNIVMVEQSQELSEVIITSQRPLIEKKADRLVMNLDNSLLAEGITANEVLKIAPLVSVNTNGAISVRGKSGVMVLVDGKNIHETSLNTALQNLPADEIERIEVITNPPARYDAAASGGVINIVTKKSLTLGLTGKYRASVSQGNYNRISTSVNLNQRREKTDIYGGINYRKGRSFKKEDLLSDFTSVGTLLDNTAHYDESYGSLFANAGVDYFLSSNHTIGLALDAYTSDQSTDIEARTDFIANQSGIDSTILSLTDWNYGYDIYNFNANYQGGIGEQELYFNATHTIYEQQSAQTLSYENAAEVEGGLEIDDRKIRLATPSTVDITIAAVDYSYAIGENLGLELGTKYTRVNSENKFMQEADDSSTPYDDSEDRSGYTEQIFAGYISVGTNVADFSLNAGVRGEYTTSLVQTQVQRDFFDLFPSLSVTRDFDANYSLALSYSRRIDRPDYDNLIPFRVFVDPYSLREGNPLLQPQYSHVVEISNTIGDITLLAGYTRVANVMLDIPYQDTETLLTTFSWQNFSLAEIYNLTLILPFQFTSWWQTNNTITGAYNYVKNQGGDTPGFDAGIASLMLNTTNTFSFRKGISAEMSGYYNSSNQYGLYRMSPIYSFDLGIGKKILGDRGLVKLKFSDILWSERVKVRASTDFIDQYARSYHDSRRVSLSFTYNFGKQTVKASDRKDIGNEVEQDRLKF